MEQNCVICDELCWLIHGFLYTITSISTDDLNDRKATVEFILHTCNEDEVG